jgi:hypothetical protein
LHDSYLKAAETLVTVYQATCQKTLIFKETWIQDKAVRIFWHIVWSPLPAVLLQLKAEYTHRLPVDSITLGLLKRFSKRRIKW